MWALEDLCLKTCFLQIQQKCDKCTSSERSLKMLNYIPVYTKAWRDAQIFNRCFPRNKVFAAKTARKNIRLNQTKVKFFTVISLFELSCCLTHPEHANRGSRLRLFNIVPLISDHCVSFIEEALATVKLHCAFDNFLSQIRLISTPTLFFSNHPSSRSHGKPCA